MAIAAVLDANVLYSIALTDFFVTTAGLGLYRVHWSPQILDEVGRNLAGNRPDLTGEQIGYRLGAMDRAMPSASVTPSEELVAQMGNHPKDRHVLAAAVAAEAGVIVTFNLKDFPAEACAPHDVVVDDPDTFATRLVADDPVLVRQAVAEMASRRKRSPTTAEAFSITWLGLFPEACSDSAKPGHRPDGRGRQGSDDTGMAYRWLVVAAGSPAN